MRIGLVIYGSLEQASGGYLYDRKLVKTLRAGGHQVRIISLARRSYLGSLSDNFSPSLFARLRRLRVDLLLQDELNHPSLFLINARLKLEGRYPIISIVHMVRSRAAPNLLQWLYRMVETKYLNSVDGFVFNSHETRRLVQSKVRGTLRSVLAAPGGDRFRPRISEANIRSRARRPGPLRVLFLGNLTRNKAPHLLIEAVAALPAEPVTVTFAGRRNVEPRYFRSLMGMAARLGVMDQINFAGYLEGRRLAATMRTCQVLALPSFYEGFGIAYLEGMGFGLPAIGTQAVGAKEMIRHGQNGFLIPAGDANSLARCLAALHSDRRLLARMSLAAQQTNADAPTWKQSMHRVVDFLEGYNETSHRPSSPRRKK